MNSHGFSPWAGAQRWPWRARLTRVNYPGLHHVNPKEETRARLLSAARKLLVKRGFHGVGLEDIAEAAGVSRQAVYKSHFASKAELLLELVRHLHVVEKLDEFMLPYLAAQSGLECCRKGSEPSC